jgi:hypothetical protein
MTGEQRIDDLINAGWHVLETDFDVVAFQHWRKLVSDCLDTLLGPDHTYTQYFEDYVQKPEKINLLTAEWILEAAKETVFHTGLVEQNGLRERQTTGKERVGSV